MLLIVSIVELNPVLPPTVHLVDSFDNKISQKYVFVFNVYFRTSRLDYNASSLFVAGTIRAL